MIHEMKSPPIKPVKSATFNLKITKNLFSDIHRILKSYDYWYNRSDFVADAVRTWRNKLGVEDIYKEDGVLYISGSIPGGLMKELNESGHDAKMLIVACLKKHVSMEHTQQKIG